MIILAEDDADHRVSLKLALQLAGYAVREAANGREALGLQRSRASRILITDLFMPDTDGFELIETFQREFAGTRIVVMSGGGKRTALDYLASAALMGVDATLQKPFEMEALLKILRRLGG